MNEASVSPREIGALVALVIGMAVRQKIYAASAGRWRNYENFLGPLQHLAEFSNRP